MLTEIARSREIEVRTESILIGYGQACCTSETFRMFYIPDSCPRFYCNHYTPMLPQYGHTTLVYPDLAIISQADGLVQNNSKIIVIFLTVDWNKSST